MKKSIKVFGKIQRYQAFTLAEVLITLGVIGVVAAITIPTIAASIEKNKLFNQFQNSYSLLANAVTSLRADYEGDFTGAFNTTDDILNAFAPKFSVLKKCTIAQDSQDCYHQYSTLKTLGGILLEPSLAHADNTSMILSNGVMLVFQHNWRRADCSYNLVVRNSVNEGCFIMHMDVNGENGPNVLGRDIFQFYLYKYGILADGVLNTNDGNSVNSMCNPSNNTDPWDGVSCAGKLVMEQKMNY